jgi:hypothetical protein
VRALPAYLRNHLQGRRSHSASTPSASNLFARGLLLCIRTRLQKRAESATGRTLSLASADVLVQIRLDLRLHFAAPYSPPCLREDRGLLAPGHFQILHKPFAVPSDLVRYFLFNGFRRPSRGVALLPCESSRSRRTARHRPACRCPARRCNIHLTASCTLDASSSSRTLVFFNTMRASISSNTLTASLIRPPRSRISRRSPPPQLLLRALASAVNSRDALATPASLCCTAPNRSQRHQLPHLHAPVLRPLCAPPDPCVPKCLFTRVCTAT